MPQGPWCVAAAPAPIYCPEYRSSIWLGKVVARMTFLRSTDARATERSSVASGQLSVKSGEGRRRWTFLAVAGQAIGGAAGIELEAVATESSTCVFLVTNWCPKRHDLA